MIIIRDFPPLYKLSAANGKILVWRIFVTDSPESPEFGIVITEHGQLDGQIIQNSEVFRTGKNLGRANATTAKEQAMAEARSRWKKKLDKGYVEDVNRAVERETDYEGGADAMLAHSFAEHTEKMLYPCAVQPKLDGIRCLATVTPGGVVSLWTRNHKRIYSVPHIEYWLWKVCGELDHTVVFDGELYNHKYRNNFETITSIVRQAEPSPNEKEVEYHIYDMIDSSGFDLRLRRLLGLLQGDHRRSIYDSACPIRIVETILVPDFDDLIDQYQYFVRQGYEGAMARRLDVPYEGKRSYSLLKIKSFKDAEFKIVDIEEGRGKLAGHVGAFICKTSDGKLFRAKMSGETARLKEYFENPELWSGKLLTVKYQNLTTEGIPRFPVGLRFRDKDGD